MGMKLDQDYTINGHLFSKGDDVETVVTETNPGNGKSAKVDYADSLKELMATTAQAVAAGRHEEPADTEASTDKETTKEK